MGMTAAVIIQDTPITTTKVSHQTQSNCQSQINVR
jgi:hypothetical protein